MAGGSSERVAEPDEKEVLVMDMEMGERKKEKWKNEKKLKVLRIASLKLYEVEVVVLFVLLAQEDVVDHPAGWLGVGAGGFLLGFPETLVTG